MTPRRNGIDLDRLAQVGSNALWQTEASVHSSWQGAVEARSTIVRDDAFTRDLTLSTDQPALQLGTDAGPTPQELVLAGISGQFIAAYVMEAARCGIVLDSLEVRTTAMRTSGGVALSFAAHVVSATGLDDLRVIGVEASHAAMALERSQHAAPSVEVTAQRPARTEDRAAPANAVAQAFGPDDTGTYGRRA